MDTNGILARNKWEYCSLNSGEGTYMYSMVDKRLKGRDNFQDIVTSWAGSIGVTFIAREKRKRKESRKKRRANKGAQSSSKKIYKELTETKKEISKLNELLVKRDRLSSDPIRDTIQMVSALRDRSDSLRNKKERLGR